MQKKVVKVELNAMKELQRVIQDAKQHIGYQEDGFKWGKKAQSAYKEYMKLWSDAEGIIRSSTKFHNKITNELEDKISIIGNAAEDIGVNPSSIAEYKNALKLLGEIRDNNGALLDWQKELNKIK
jgi:hypothetical protein